MTERDKDEGLAWNDIPPDIRAQMIEAGRERLFWSNVGKRLGWLKGIATIFLTLAAAYALFREGLADWLIGHPPDNGSQ